MWCLREGGCVWCGVVCEGGWVWCGVVCEGGRVWCGVLGREGVVRKGKQRVLLGREGGRFGQEEEGECGEREDVVKGGW